MTKLKYSALAASCTVAVALLCADRVHAQETDAPLARNTSGESLPEPGELLDEEEDSGKAEADDVAPDVKAPADPSAETDEAPGETESSSTPPSPNRPEVEDAPEIEEERGVQPPTEAESRPTRSAPVDPVDPVDPEEGPNPEGSADAEGPETKLPEETAPDSEIARVRTVPREPVPSEELKGETDDAGVDRTGDLFRIARRVLDDRNGSPLDLKPYVDDPKWREAMQMVVDDECDEALDRIDSILEESARPLEEFPAVRYAIGRAKMCGGASSEGRATLQRLSKGDGPVAELARRHLGDDPSPIEPTEEAAPDWRDRLEEARRLASDGELDAALSAFESLREDVTRKWHRYKVEMAEANVLLRAGEAERAGRLLRGIYEMARTWSVGDRVAAKIRRVENRHGIDILPLGSRIDRMRELIADGKYTKAKNVSIENAKIAGVGEPEITGWSLYRRGLQAERQRRRQKAARMFERAEGIVESPVLRPRLYFGWARALRRIDRDSEAIELYERLWKEYPDHHLSDDARFEAARLNQYRENHDRARELFADIVGLHGESGIVVDSLWRGALSAYVQGDYDGVDPPLQQILELDPDRRDASGLPVTLKARYWLGAAAYKRGDLELARTRLQETINRGALTWYGRLAAERMRRMGEQPVVPLPSTELTRRKLEDLSQLDLPDTDRYRVAAEYARLGLYEDAIEEMKRQMDVSPVPEKAHRFLANLYLVDGRTTKAHWMMNRRIGLSTPTWQDLRDWGIAYPVDYMQHGHRYGAEFGVSPFLVQGIMRQESGFRPKVASYVGAVGLMQLMPGTANSVSDDFFDGEHVSRTELREPSTNIRLGTTYIGALTEWVDGRIPMALAGYNAGPAPLKSWFRRYGEREMDVWVESITYEQARGYVRKVFTSYVRYAALYGGTLPRVQFELPDEIGDWEDLPDFRPDDPSSEPISMVD